MTTGSALADRTIAVVGASLAGMTALDTLRSEGYAGRVVVISAEPHHPYDRTPLSKGYLADDEVLALELPQNEALTSANTDLRFNTRAQRFWAADRSIELAAADGTSETIVVDGVIAATGASVRRLPHQGSGVHVVRTLDDAQRLRNELRDGAKSVVIIGGGFIGLEVAAAARKLGNNVVVVEAANTPLVRSLGPLVGGFLVDLHAAEGVEIRCGVDVGRVAGDEVVLDGVETAADVVVVGIGAKPVVDWLAGSGVDLDDGVVCGADLNAGFEGVYVAGDLARWFHPLYGYHVRVEHWTNATRQGAAAAKNLLAELRGERTTPFDAIPYFWSDQYGHRLQFAGLPNGADRVEIIAGSPSEGRFAALYGRDGFAVGLFGIDMEAAISEFRARAAERPSWDDAVRFCRAAEGN